MGYWKYMVVVYVKADDETEAVDQGRQMVQEDPAGWDYEIVPVTEAEAKREAYYLREV